MFGVCINIIGIPVGNVFWVNVPLFEYKSGAQVNLLDTRHMLKLNVARCSNTVGDDDLRIMLAYVLVQILLIISLFLLSQDPRDPTTLASSMICLYLALRSSSTGLYLFSLRLLASLKLTRPLLKTCNV